MRLGRIAARSAITRAGRAAGLPYLPARLISLSAVPICTHRGHRYRARRCQEPPSRAGLVVGLIGWLILAAIMWGVWVWLGHMIPG